MSEVPLRLSPPTLRKEVSVPPQQVQQMQHLAQGFTNLCAVDPNAVLTDFLRSCGITQSLDTYVEAIKPFLQPVDLFRHQSGMEEMNIGTA